MYGGCSRPGAKNRHSNGVKLDQLTERLRDRLAAGHEWASAMLDAEIAAGLGAANRVIIQIVPTTIHLIQPQG